MTVETTTSRVSYTGAGTTGPFTIGFYFIENDDIRAIKVLIADGTETELVLDTDFTLTGAGDADGGEATLTDALTSSYNVVFFRDPEVLQEAAYPKNDPFPSATHERVVDRLTMIAQRQASLLDRSLRQPDGDTADIGALPAKLERASTVLGFDADGEPATYNPASAVTDAANVTTTASGTGSFSESMQSHDRWTRLITDKMSDADRASLRAGSTIDVTTALTNAISDGAGTIVFPYGKYSIGSQVTFSTAGIKLFLLGATIYKGFSGDLFSVTAAGFAIDGEGTLNGQHGTYTGKGILFSTSSSINPYIGPGILFDSFTDTHIEFGADAGKYAKIDANLRAATSPAQSDPRMIHCTGTDTTAMQRDINGSMNGYIDLDAAISTHVRSPLITRVEISSTCGVTLVSGVSWSNNGNAMTISGDNTIITGCRFSGDVTLDANFNGAFVGNIQTAGTFTNSATSASALVYHHPLSANYVVLGKHQLTVDATTAHQILTSAITSAGDADITFTPGTTSSCIRYATSLTATRAVTLSTTGAATGTRCLITRPAGDTGGPWLVTIGSTGQSLRINEWIIVEYTGSAYVTVSRGPLVANNEHVSADNGDAAATLTPGSSYSTLRFNTIITANRAVTLNTATAWNGAKFRIVREASCTGAFNINVGTGPLKALGSASTWCDVQYDGSAWRLVASGSL